AAPPPRRRAEPEQRRLERLGRGVGDGADQAGLRRQLAHLAQVAAAELAPALPRAVHQVAARHRALARLDLVERDLAEPRPRPRHADEPSRSSAASNGLAEAWVTVRIRPAFADSSRTWRR